MPEEWYAPQKYDRLEGNADVVSVVSYAPLFAHIDDWQWTPDLNWINNLKSYGTSDYHVRKLFSINRNQCGTGYASIAPYSFNVLKIKM